MNGCQTCEGERAALYITLRIVKTFFYSALCKMQPVVTQAHCSVCSSDTKTKCCLCHCSVDSGSGEGGGLRDAPVEVVHLLLSHLLSTADVENLGVSAEQKEAFFKTLTKGLIFACNSVLQFFFF